MLGLGGVRERLVVLAMETGRVRPIGSAMTLTPARISNLRLRPAARASLTACEAFDHIEKQHDRDQDRQAPAMRRLDRPCLVFCTSVESRITSQSMSRERT
jgi:hypothetical protein